MLNYIDIDWQTSSDFSQASLNKICLTKLDLARRHLSAADLDEEL
ncbi:MULTISPECIES: hypothetical protein [Sorangium]|nr:MULTISPECIES: hypothetical protein [Sorangium]